MVETYRAHPSELAGIRERVRELASNAGLSRSRVQDLVLAVSEAAANAILHSGTDQLHLTWRQLGNRIEVEVEDGGVFRRRVPMPEVDGAGGHGISIMAALVDDIRISEGTERQPGTKVRLALDTRSAESG